MTQCHSDVSASASSRYRLGEKAPSEKVFEQAIVDCVHLELQTAEVLVQPVVDDFTHRGNLQLGAERSHQPLGKITAGVHGCAGNRV